MNWDQVEGNWKQAVGRLKEKWGRLSDDQLTEIGGRKDSLVGKIQELYGATRDEAERQVNDWLSDMDRSGNPLQGAPGFAQQSAAEAGEAAAQWWDDTRRSFSRSAEAMSAAIEDRPLVALGCALGVGVVLGLALGRR